MKNIARKCSTCGEEMQFIGYVDTETGEDLKVGFIEELTMGRHLTGSVRKYQCLKGHVETNKNEVLPARSFQILGEDNLFRNARDLVGYAERHAETERALMRFDHLVCLAYIAGWKTEDITPESFTGEKKCFKSLHSYPDLVVDAKRRLDAGDIPEDWLEQLSKQIETQGQ